MASYRLQLHNYLQEAFKNQTALSYDTRQLGPEHKSDWEAIANINHMEYGRGTAAKLDDAKEQAAYQALVRYRGW